MSIHKENIGNASFTLHPIFTPENSQSVVAAFNAFAQQQNDEKIWRIVVMDNAPIITVEHFKIASKTGC